jgi:hypothetical protein
MQPKPNTTKVKARYSRLSQYNEPTLRHTNQRSGIFKIDSSHSIIPYSSAMIGAVNRRLAVVGKKQT